MTLPLEHYLSLPYAVRVTPYTGADGAGGYFATIAELSGCESHGNTPDEARANLREALALYFATMLEDGIEPPPPTAAVQVVVWQTAPAAAASWAIPAPPLRPGSAIVASRASVVPA